MFKKVLFTLLFTQILFANAQPPALFAQSTDGAHSRSTIVQQPLTSDTLTTFVNTFMQEQMAALHVPGAAVVVVQQDQVVFAQGYGMADLAQRIPVDVNHTLFRAGSISKLFTATAVMQLVEQGKLDLHTDIDLYLQSMQLDDRFDRPVTVADLLLHTAGFDDVFFGMHVRDAADLQPLADYLRLRLPARYLPPGAFISYNDHGYTLAGLVVEEVSGMPFDQYVATHILTPLQMEQSTFTQPLPASQRAQMAVGYRYDGADYQPYELDFVQVSPAAALIGPAGEMANFMIAHLNNGHYAGHSILAPATVANMHQIHFAHHPALRGRAYGFAEWRENGQRALFHDGGNPGFLSRLFLLPEQQVGFYLVFNSDQYTSASRFHRTFTTQFLEIFFATGEDQGQSQGETATSPLAAAPTLPARAFAGYYREIQGYSHDTLQKVAALMNQFPVRATGEKLTVFGRDYKAMAPLVFENAAAESTIVFRGDGQGAVTHLFVGTGAYAKVPWYEAQPVQLGIGLWFLLLCIAALVGGIVGWMLPYRLRWQLVAGGLLNIVFLVGLASALLQMDTWRFVYGPPLIIKMLLCLPLTTLVITLLIVGQTVRGLYCGKWRWWVRIYLILVNLSLLGFPLFLHFWNLLGFRY